VCVFTHHYACSNGRIMYYIIQHALLSSIGLFDHFIRRVFCSLLLPGILNSERTALIHFKRAYLRYLYYNLKIIRKGILNVWVILFYGWYANYCSYGGSRFVPEEDDNVTRLSRVLRQRVWSDGIWGKEVLRRISGRVSWSNTRLEESPWRAEPQFWFLFKCKDLWRRQNKG
jgi:hypothetical protein